MKPYFDRVTSEPATVERSATEGGRPVCTVGRASTVHTPESVTAEVEDGLPDLDPCVLHGRLKNLA